MTAPLPPASTVQVKNNLADSEACALEWKRELALEREADALLCALPHDPDCPTYTEPQLARRGRHCCLLSTGAWLDTLAAGSAQSIQDELMFLAAIAPLSWRERACLRSWILGWTQREIGARWNDPQEVKEERKRAARTRLHASEVNLALPPTQQAISRLLRRALDKCYEAIGVSFTQFSRRAVYRRPITRQGTWRVLCCPFCCEVFVFGLGVDRYCSQSCREAARHRRAYRDRP